MVVQCRVELRPDRRQRRRPGQVAQLVGVGLQVEELGLRQRPAVPPFHRRPVAGVARQPAAVHVDRPAPVAAQQLVAGAAHGPARRVVPLPAAAAPVELAERPFPARRGALAGEAGRPAQAADGGRRRQAAQLGQGREQVHVAAQALHGRAGADHAGQAQQQRGAQPGVVGSVLGARHRGAVLGGEDHQGGVAQAGAIERGEDDANAAVQFADLPSEGSQVAPRGRGVRQVGRHFHALRQRRVVAGAERAVALPERHRQQERRRGGALRGDEGSRGRGLVVVGGRELLGKSRPPGGVRNHQTPAQHGAVAGIAKPRRHGGGLRRQRLLAGDAHLVRHQPGQDGGAARNADRRGRRVPGEARAAGRESVQVGRPQPGAVVTAQPVPQIVAIEVDHVGAGSGTAWHAAHLATPAASRQAARRGPDSPAPPTARAARRAGPRRRANFGAEDAGGLGSRRCLGSEAQSRLLCAAHHRYRHVGAGFGRPGEDRQALSAASPVRYSLPYGLAVIPDRSFRA